MTPLHWAVERGHFDSAEILLRNNAEVLVRNKFEKSPIEIALDNHSTAIYDLLQVRSPFKFPSLWFYVSCPMPYIRVGVRAITSLLWSLYSFEGYDDEPAGSSSKRLGCHGSCLLNDKQSCSLQLSSLEFICVFYQASVILPLLSVTRFVDVVFNTWFLIGQLCDVLCFWL